MPVLGHAFVGLATAIVIRPARRSPSRAAFWPPILIGLAYLPDILKQVISLAGFGSHPIVTHSIAVSAAAVLILAWPLARFAGISILRGGAIVAFSLGVHLLLDVLQATDRQPFWPFSDRNLGLGLRVIPVNSLYEVLVFGGFLLVSLAVVRHFRRAGVPAAGSGTSPEPAGRAGAVWIGRCGYATVAIVMVFATVTHYLVHVRQQQLKQAKHLINKGDCEAAFERLDDADRWPAPFRPGTTDFFRGKALLQLGDREGAEATFRGVCRVAPLGIYAFEQLALMCASSDGSIEERAKCMEPWVDILGERFSDHPRTPWIREKLERRLGRPVNLEVPERRPTD